MAEYIRVRRCDVSEDSFERTKGLANEQAQDQHTQMLVCKVVGIVKPQEPVYEPLEEPEPPKKKALDVTLEQNGQQVTVTVNHADPRLMKEKRVLIDGLVKINTDNCSYTRAYGDQIIVGGRDSSAVCGFPSAEAATKYVEHVHCLLDIINANEPQEGGEA
jgi:hypothetical protein